MEEFSLSLREDVPATDLPSSEEILAGAPETQSGFFVVPKIRADEETE